MLPTADLSGVVGHRVLVFEHEGDFDDACNTGSHKRVAKHSVNHGGKRQGLRVSGHGEASEEDYNAGN